MRHVSIPKSDTIQFVNIEPTEISPLISKCQIKVCYVGDEPNRNKSIITKETAMKMAPSLRGSMIVGHYNEAQQDYEEHNKTIEVANGQFNIKDDTFPYGFVNTDAKVWFETFTDDGVDHEYLMTEGYLWTGQLPECKRIIEHGNNQSMELDEKSLNAYWTKDGKGNCEFFIINEAIISKLCILGEEVEPCFEGASIGKIEFSFGDDFSDKVTEFISQMKEIIDKGGTPVYNTFAVEIGDALWESLHNYLRKSYPGVDEWCSRYRVEGIFEEGAQKFAILQDFSDNKYYRMNFSLTEAEGFVASPEMVEVTKEYVPAEKPQFSLEEVEAYQAEYKKKNSKKEDKKEDEEKKPEEDSEKKESKKDKSADKEEKKPEEKEDKSSDKEEKKPEDKGDKKSEEDDESEEDKKKKKKKYNLEEVEEYTTLKVEYDELQTKYAAVIAEKEALEKEKEALTEQNTTLNQFKLDVERKDKEDMIYKTFYMLDNEYKKDVIENIDTYSLDDIEAKLSVICVRNKVNFNLDSEENNGVTTFNLDQQEEDVLPAWVKVAKDVAKSMKI